MKIPAAVLLAMGLGEPLKYRNKISHCLSKHRHDSRAESDYCNSLLADIQAGRIGGFRVQQRWRLSSGVTHIVDFEILDHKLEIIEVHDVKGVQTEVWRIKHKLFKEKYPEIKYVVVNRKEGYGTRNRGRSKGRACGNFK